MSVLMFIIINWLRKDVKNKEGVGNEIADHFGKKTVANKNHETMGAGTQGVHVQQELGKGDQSMAKSLT